MNASSFVIRDVNLIACADFILSIATLNAASSFAATLFSKSYPNLPAPHSDT
jgi:hypothetical protein